MIDKMLSVGWVIVDANTGRLIRECFTKADALSELRELRDTHGSEAWDWVVDRAQNWNDWRVPA